MKKVIGAKMTVTLNGQKETMPTIGLDVPGASFTNFTDPKRFVHIMVIQGKLFKMVATKETLPDPYIRIAALDDMEEIEQLTKPTTLKIIANNGEELAIDIDPIYQEA